MTPRRGSAGSSPAVLLEELDPELRKQLEKKVGRKLRRPRNQWPKSEVQRYAIRCLYPLADLTAQQRARVLAHAAKLNDV